MAETVWSTVDRLIHDLGAIRAFVDEAEAVPDFASAPEVSDVRGAMDRATDAITHIFTDTEDAAVQAAWTAIAQAQDAVARARAMIATARAGSHAAGRMQALNEVQARRARDQREVLLDRASGFRVTPPASAERARRDDDTEWR